MAKRESQKSHDTMVASAGQYLRQKGFSDVRADIQGYNQPEKIVWSETNEGHIPDLSAKGKKFNLFEVETEDSISDDHTRDQWTLFAAYAKKFDSDFWIIVPKECHGLVKQRLVKLGIEAKVWTP